MIGGLMGAYAWALLKMVLPFAGAFGLLLNLVVLVIYVVKRKRRLKLFTNMVVNLALFSPILLTLNIIPVAYPNNIANAQPSVTVSWPLTETTIVGWGGDAVSDNVTHVIWPSERWAYDLVMEPYDMNSRRNEDYGIWDKEIVSPVAGTVIAAFDKEADITPGSEDFDTLEGNHVYIKIKETGTYLLLNHLKKGSATVQAGDEVKPGDLVGRVGNSGSTSEPHLHIHHQRQDPTKAFHPVLAEGLPLYFKDTQGEEMPTKRMIIDPEQ